MKNSNIDNNDKDFNILMKEISNGEKQALEKFYSLYGKLIYSVALSVSKSSFLSDEIVNDVLVKIWQVSKEQGIVEKPISWLYTITFNCAIDRVKKEKQLYEIYDMPQEDANINNVLNKDSFYCYISELNDEEQQVYVLRFIQDLCFKDIAKAINKPVSSISSIYYRAIKKLKNTINKF